MLVIDASLPVKWLAVEPENQAARTLLAAPDPLIGLDWIVAEEAYALRGKAGRSEMRAQSAIEAGATLFTADQKFVAATRGRADPIELLKAS